MKKRILFTALAAVMLFSSVSGLGNFSTAYAEETPPPCTHEWNEPIMFLRPTEGKNGILRYYCKYFTTCGGYLDEYVERLPNVYVSKFKGDDKGLCTRITAHQRYNITDGELSIAMEDWNANLVGHQYNYNWQDAIITNRAIEFKARDVGVGYFNDSVDTYALDIPLRAVTDCDKNGAVVVYLTTGAAIVRLSEDATAALIENAEECIGVVVTRDGDNVCAQLTVDGEAVEAPNGVEMLYWVKDAGDNETAPEKVLSSYKYKNFALEGKFDLMYVESLNGVVNCNK